MSFRKLDLTEEAERDIRSILRFTRATWGVRQRDIYAQQLRSALNQLTRFPELGERQEFLPPEVRAHRAGQHVIYYWLRPELISVLRILHSRMDAAAQFASWRDET
jgi:toxin ParE1/3/4